MRQVLIGVLAGIFLALFIFGCASATEIVPDLPQRTLRISRTLAGFEYHYAVCKKKFLGSCTKTEMHIDYYDLNDLQTRNKLIDMGFVAKVREKIH